MLEIARRKKAPFLKDWAISPLEITNKKLYPIINIEYSFEITEEEFLEQLGSYLKTFREKYGIQKPISRKIVNKNQRMDMPSYQARELRDRWLQVKYFLLKSAPSYLPKQFRKHNRIYIFIRKELKELEAKNFFKFPRRKSSPYDLPEASIKRIINLRKSK